MKKQHFFLGLFLFLFIGMNQTALQSQNLGKILRDTKRQVERSLSDKLADAAADQAAKEAEKSLDKLFQKAYEDAIKGDSTRSSHDTSSVDYDALSRLILQMEDVDLPEAYQFDLSLLVEMKEPGEEASLVRLYYSKSNNNMAVEQDMGDGEQQLMVMDAETDVMVMYITDANGQKTAQVIPSLAKTGLAIGVVQKEEEAFSYKIDATGKSKQVAGYACQEYEGGNEETAVRFYASAAVPINWQDGFANIAQYLAPNSYTEEFKKVEGMVLESYTHEKDKPDEISSWITKEVSQQAFSIQNSDYQFQSLTGQ